MDTKVIQMYAPVANKDQEFKKEFYDYLKDLMQSTSSNYFMIIMAIILRRQEQIRRQPTGKGRLALEVFRATA